MLADLSGHRPGVALTRVLIVDDHPVFRQGLATLLSATGIDVVGEAASAEEAIRLATSLEPDVVLMDLGLPDASGVHATEVICASLDSTRVVVVTMHDDDGTVRSAFAAGATGFVVKDATSAEILAAVDAAVLGARLIGSGVTTSLTAGNAVPHDPWAGYRLSPRERQVADLVAKGLGNRIIATRLGLSGKTVANYVSALLLKLGADDRDQAITLLRGGS
jgi:DNA-binding NarL/FixJ family response regulator